jgi:hypothetical protein
LSTCRFMQLERCSFMLRSSNARSYYKSKLWLLINATQFKWTNWFRIFTVLHILFHENLCFHKDHPKLSLALAHITGRTEACEAQPRTSPAEKPALHGAKCREWTARTVSLTSRRAAPKTEQDGKVCHVCFCGL